MDSTSFSKFDISKFLDPEALVSAPITSIEDAEKSLGLEVKDGKLNWVTEVFSEDLHPSLSGLLTVDEVPQVSILEEKMTPEPLAFTPAGLDLLFHYIRQDVFGARHKLLALNPTRRSAIERRLEVISRKIARARGERMNRSLCLTELLKESFRPQQKEKTLGILALEKFTSEVALYFVFQLFVIKSLDSSGWREYVEDDLQRLGFVLHEFLQKKSLFFSADKHSWNFVRPNIYSWYALSPNTFQECSRFLTEGFSLQFSGFTWNQENFNQWIRGVTSQFGLEYLGFAKDNEMGTQIWNFLERDLGIPLISEFQGHLSTKRVFIPSSESGGILVSAMPRILNDQIIALRERDPRAAEQALSHILWACETEGLETFFVEVNFLLSLASRLPSKSRNKSQVPHSFDITSMSPASRISQGTRIVQTLALELYNQEQLSFGGNEPTLLQSQDKVFSTQQGAAAFIQEYESFDVSVVLDHPDRMKSTRWLKAIADQAPYWRKILSSNSNLNWGELHLFLALSKLKDLGVCLFLSHKVLPDQGDGEKFRKYVLGIATLDFFMELPENIFGEYKYLYVFTKQNSKKDRDQHRVRFGKWPENCTTPKDSRHFLNIVDMLEHRFIEESSSSQWEIAERGWDQIFVRGAAPLIRHLNHKFPKLFQVASIQIWSKEKSTQNVQEKTKLFSSNLFSTQNPLGLEFHRNGNALEFVPINPNNQSERIVIYPHNTADIPWIQSLLNSEAVQFWIKLQITADPGPVKLQDLKNLPLVDLSRTHTDLIQEASLFLSKQKPTVDLLRRWTLEVSDSALLYSRYIALSKRRFLLDSTISRYRHLFDRLDRNLQELNPESVPLFYPKALLIPISQSPEIRVQYTKKDLTPTNPSNWIVKETFITPHLSGRFEERTLIHIFTKQGPQIVLSAPNGVSSYLNAQLQKLREFTWGEVQNLLRIPKDLNLFSAQTAEIVRVVGNTIQEMMLFDEVLQEISLELFEIRSEDRQYLNRTATPTHEVYH